MLIINKHLNGLKYYKIYIFKNNVKNFILLNHFVNQVTNTHSTK